MAKNRTTAPPAEPALLTLSDRERALLRALGPWVGPVLLVAVGLYMVHYSWGRLTDPLVDFGRELYVAWRLAAGDRLYADVAYFNGPLSPYVNAAIFRLLGVSLRSLMLANLAVLAGVVALVYHLVGRLSDRLTATAAGVLVLTLLAFGHHSWVGNYNFATPYSHEATHGLALSLAGLAMLGAYLRSGRWGWLAGAGLALGLTLLTKVEVGLAAGVALGGGTLLALATSPLPTRRRWVHAGVFVLAGLVPIGVAWALLARVLPAELAWRGVLGSWLHATNPALSAMPFYRRMMGLAEWPRQLAWIAVWTVGYGLFWGLLAWVGRRLGDGARRSLLAGLVTAAVLLGLTLALWRVFWFADALMPLPVLLGGLLAW